MHEIKTELELTFTQNDETGAFEMTVASQKRFNVFKQNTGVVYNIRNTRTLNEFDKNITLKINNIDGTDKLYVVVCPANATGVLSLYNATIYKHVLPYNTLKRYLDTQDFIFGADLKTCENESLYAEDGLFVHYLAEKGYKFTNTITHNNKKYHKPPDAHVLQHMQSLNKEVYVKIKTTDFAEINISCDTEIEQTKGFNLSIVFEFTILSVY